MYLRILFRNMRNVRSKIGQILNNFVWVRNGEKWCWFLRIDSIKIEI